MDTRAIRPPVLRTHRAEAGERRASWTELFFDLVFVVAVGQATQILSDDPSRRGATWFAFVFVAVTWSWTNYVMYTERFDTDDVVHRLTKAAAMVAVAAVAYTAPDARGDRAVEFVMAYVAMRAVLISLYVRAWRHVPEVRDALAVYIGGFSLGATCWLVSLLAPEDVRPALWVAGVVIEILTPLVGWHRLGDAAAAEEHLQERSGQFTLIVLGEVVVRNVDGLHDVNWDGRAWSAVLAVALIVVCVWWLTFDFVDSTVPPGLRAFAYLSAHIPAYTAIAALGVGVELAFHHLDEGALVEHGRWILCGAAALYLFGVTCIRATVDRRLHLLAVHPFAAALLLGVAAVGDSLSALAVLSVVAGVLGAELLFKGTVLGWSGRADEELLVSGRDGGGSGRAGEELSRTE